VAASLTTGGAVANDSLDNICDALALDEKADHSDKIGGFGGLAYHACGSATFCTILRILSLSDDSASAMTSLVSNLLQRTSTSNGVSKGERAKRASFEEDEHARSEQLSEASS